MTTTINHDGFARQELVRDTISPAAKALKCDWCGGSRRGGGLFRYGIRRDDSLRGVINWHRGQFCGRSCHHSYHREG